METGELEENNAETTEALLEQLKSQKRVSKMQLTKLYSRLVRLTSAESVDTEAILCALEDTEEKKLEVTQLLEDLVSVYANKGDERNVARSEAEIDKITEDTDREIAAVKEFLSSSFKKSRSLLKDSDVLSRSDFSEERAPNQVDLQLPKLPKPSGIEVIDKVYEKPFKPAKTTDTSLEKVDRKLERIKLPNFNGDKAKFDQFWAAFETIVDQTDEPAKYKMIRLRSCLEGKAEEAISRLGFSEEAYEEAKNILERRFGGKRRQVQNYLEELKKVKPLQEGNIQDLETFADILVSTVVTLREHRRWNELEPGSLLFTIVVEKLPKSMLSRFFRWSSEAHRSESLETLREWITEESEYQVKAVESIEGLSAKGRRNRTFTTLKGRRKPEQTDERRQEQSEPQRKCSYCQRNHGIWVCQGFKVANVDERWRVAKEKRLCFRCLSNNHQGKDCPRSGECGVNGCKRTHHKLLHPPEELGTQDGTSNAENSPLPPTRVFTTVSGEDNELKVEQGTEEHSNVTTLASAQQQELVSLRTVPVWLSAGGKKVKVNAVLDDASSVSYVNEEVAGALGLSSTYEQVKVNVLNECVETFDSMPVSLTLENCDGNVRLPFKALTCPRRVTGNYKTVDWQRYQDRWPHLRVCKFPDPTADPIVDVLIGQDHIDLHFSKCDVRGNPRDPIARLGPLGWSCIGQPEGKIVGGNPRTNLACTFFSRPQIFDEINDTLKRFWEIDTLGIQQSKPQMLTREEKIALDKVRHSLVYDGERYQVAVPWKSSSPALPNNYEMAYSRLNATEKRLIRQNSVGENYKQIIISYVEKGYIRKVQESEREAQGAWYLPHFPVCRPERATTKTRIVFDASAKFQGLSLNDEILPGPKLQNSLFDVLLRFRRFPIAVVCDVTEMYLQIRIPPEDRPKFRFLWRNLNVDQKPDVYEFERVVFGDASAPFRAQFVSQENARAHQKEFPLAAATVSNSTYMDDSLDSVRDNATAIRLYQELQELWGKAGMKARKWLSNSPEVLAEIPKEQRAFEIDLDSSLPATKTLGVLWRAQPDVFAFQVKKPTEDDHLTKRTILSKVAGVFDPLGLASPFVVRAKIIIQDMWTKGLGWDELIDRQFENRARDWFSDLENLEDIKIPRCLQESRPEKSTSVHTFVDASNDAYGAVSYLRSEYPQRSYGVSIIASKTRVAPLTPMSTPRLELMAAILGLRLTISILGALNIPITQAHFWSDSMNVLYWIRGKGRQFRPFVANRIGEIQGQSEPEQWQYVASKENPADLCSRGLDAGSLKNSNLWWNGPDYLSKNFVGADRELRELIDALDSNTIQDKTADKGVRWSFNPPLAPHFGGVHEVMIKAAKKAIRAVLSNADVNDEELMTAFVGVEALLNSRPLTYQTADSKDATPLTPNHFLHGQLGGLSAPKSVDEIAFNPRKRWRRVQELITHFWRRWLKEWLPLLNARQKWTEAKPDLKVGDVVLAISPDCPRAQWPLGRVLEVFPGPDGHVRVVKLQVGQNTVVRPITKCVPLESD